MSAIISGSPTPFVDRERVLVLGGAGATLDLLRLAVLRSDEIQAVIAAPDPQVRRFAAQFAVDLLERPAREDDLAGIGAALIAIGNIGLENHMLRAARRHGVPVHVANRPLVSDFTLRQFLEQRSFARLAA